MKRSTERILTTHVGSLPRPDDLRAMILKRSRARRSTPAFAARVNSAVGAIVKRQSEAGIDIVADGEMGRVGFIPYVNERLAGIEPSPRSGAGQLTGTSRANTRRFRNFTPGRRRCRAPPAQTGRTRWVCTGPVSYKGHGGVAARHRNAESRARRRAARGSLHAGGVAGQPRQLEPQRALQERGGIPLSRWPTHLREEYRAIIDAGLVLQVDDPLLASIT